jgi:5'-nucleotidase
MMKNIYAIVSLFFLVLSLNAQERRIVILHTNDMHSRLAGFAPESAYTPLTVNDDKTIGGFARIATLIRDEKRNKSQVTVVIDAGDFLMGTLFHTVEAGTGFQLTLMKKMGYDIVSIGNHEFDFGPAILAQIINSSVRNGEIPELMLGNALFSATDDSDNSLEDLFTKSFIKRTFIKDFDGIKIGFFALMGVDADKVAPRAKPVTFSNRTDFARKAVNELKAKGCEIIICISHSGVVKDKNGEWAGEDVDLAKNVRGISLIISAHTHTKIEKTFIVAGIPVVQAGEYGEFVGKVVLAGSNGAYRLESYELLSVDDRISGDKETDDLIREQEDKITGKILRPLGMDYNMPIVESPVTID